MSERGVRGRPVDIDTKFAVKMVSMSTGLLPNHRVGGMRLPALTMTRSLSRRV
jgi:hypothetical protein